MLFKSKKTNIPDYEETFVKKNNIFHQAYYKIKNTENAALSHYTSQTIFVMDYSYSMEDNYRKGRVNKIFETILPLGIKLGNGTFVDVILFNRGFYKMPNLRVNNCQTYLKRYLPNYQKFPMGGTEYSPVLSEILKIHNQSNKISPNIITYVVFFTDNDCNAYDIRKTYTLMNKITSENIFFQFVKIGDNTLNTLYRLDQEFCNASLLNENIMENISDAELYEKLLVSYNEWLKSIQK